MSSITGPRRSFLAVVALAFSASLASPPEGRAGGCGGDEGGSPPSAGHYKGSYKLVYKAEFANLPAQFVSTNTWYGDLSFDLGRPDLDDSARPLPPPPPPLRIPLRAPQKAGDAPPAVPSDRAAPGQFGGDNAKQVAAYWEAEKTRVERNEALARQRQQEIVAKLPPSHMHVSKTSNPTIKGDATGRMEVKMSVVMPGATGGGNAGSTEPDRYEVRGEESPGDGRFTKIEIQGKRRSSPFAYRAEATGPGGHGKKGGTVGGKDGDGEVVHIADLLVEGTECHSMKGRLDIEEYRASFAKWGKITVISSEWTATLDERDEAFEKQVDALDSEPIPMEIDWPAIDHFKDAAAGIREGAAPLTDYKRCVLKKLERKFVRMNLAALATLTRYFPKASDGATVVVMRAMLERILPLERVLQLYGAGDCPEVAAAEAAATRELSALLKSILDRKHTFEELMPFLVLQSSGQLGDLAGPFQSEIDAYVAASGAAK